MLCQVNVAKALILDNIAENTYYDISSTRFIFGFVLVLVDMKDTWANSFFGLQTKLFLYCNFLASQTGRACFYFYVGSISLFLLPSSETLLNFSLFFSPLEVQRAIESHRNTLPFHCHSAVSCFNIIQSRPQEMWMILYIILGGWLCLLGLVMLGLRFCQCCFGNDPPQNPPGPVGQATHVQS